MSEGPTPSPWLLVALVCSVALLLGATAESWVTDDALITFRYVDNFVSGHGLVFNPGERVEGLSNPLFALVLSAFQLVGLSPYGAAPAIGIAASVVELLLLTWLLWRTTGKWLASAVGGALFCTDRIVAVWSTGGLETSTHGLLLFGTFAAAVLQRATPKSVRLVSLLCVALAASRPEGVLLYPVYLVWLFLDGRSQDNNAWRQQMLTSLKFFLPGLLLLVGARLLYYGDFVPNTYYAKVDAVPTADYGLLYLEGFARRMGCMELEHFLPWLGLVAALAFARRDEESAAAPSAHVDAWRALGAGALFSCALMLITSAMGGDYMGDFRFYRPLMGLLYFTVATAFVCVADGQRFGRPIVVVLVIALGVSHMQRQAEASPLADDAPNGPDHKRVLTIPRERAEDFTAALMHVAEAQDSLLVDWAGFRGYGHRLRTIDAAGLVSRHLERDFYVRPDRDERTGARVRLPGHARWPRVRFLEREHITFIFPKVSPRGPEVAEVTENSPRRHRGYPFLHVVVPLPLAPGQRPTYLRFFTMLDREELAERAALKGTDICARAPFGELECFRGEPDEL